MACKYKGKFIAKSWLNSLKNLKNTSQHVKKVLFEDKECLMPTATQQEGSILAESTPGEMDCANTRMLDTPVVTP